MYEHYTMCLYRREITHNIPKQIQTILARMWSEIKGTDLLFFIWSLSFAYISRTTRRKNYSFNLHLNSSFRMIFTLYTNIEQTNVRHYAVNQGHTHIQYRSKVSYHRLTRHISFLSRLFLFERDRSHLNWDLSHFKQDVYCTCKPITRKFSSIAMVQFWWPRLGKKFSRKQSG